MRQTYKKGPFERENLSQDGDPPVSHPAKGGGQRRQSGAGRTPGSAETRLPLVQVRC